MENKQTAVEFLITGLKLLFSKRENGMNVLDFRNEFDKLTEQVLKMEELQHELTWVKSENGKYKNITFEQYYSETYKSE